MRMSKPVKFHSARRHLPRSTEERLVLLIVDEGSMVDEDLWDDIYDVCSMVQLNILAVGDPFQLEPVKQREPTENPSI
jgi:hypothetical protein